MRGVEVRDEDEGDTAIRGHGGEKLLEGVEPAGRGDQPGHGQLRSGLVPSQRHPRGAAATTIRRLAQGPRWEVSAVGAACPSRKPSHSPFLVFSRPSPVLLHSSKSLAPHCSQVRTNREPKKRGAACRGFPYNKYSAAPTFGSLSTPVTVSRDCPVFQQSGATSLIGKIREVAHERALHQKKMEVTAMTQAISQRLGARPSTPATLLWDISGGPGRKPGVRSKAAICELIGRLQQEYIGRGPSDIRASSDR